VIAVDELASVERDLTHERVDFGAVAKRRAAGAVRVAEPKVLAETADVGGILGLGPDDRFVDAGRQNGNDALFVDTLAFFLLGPISKLFLSTLLDDAPGARPSPNRHAAVHPPNVVGSDQSAPMFLFRGRSFVTHLD
jgi:hypothetical protein